MTLSRCVAALLLPLLVSACQDSNTDHEKDARMSAELAAFQQSQDAWRAQRHASLVAVGGWASLIGLHWLEPGPHFLGSDADNGIQLAMGPEHIGMIELERDGRIRLVPEQEAALTLDGRPVAGEVALLSDEDQGGPSELGFDGGQGVLTVIRRGDRHALRVKHERAPTRLGFSGLDYWPADPGWRIEGRFIAHPPGRKLEVASIVGTLEAVANPGAVEFERDGVGYRLETIDEGEEALFVVFADRTNGQGSYGAGRFVYVPRPGADGRVTIDFNRSYNPPCAFTPFATCPLPPDDNRLDLAVTAGEKAYRHSAP